jgi:glyoxylase-like metal-dependent hydrolase (beta-lactamase superfamily II)
LKVHHGGMSIETPFPALHASPPQVLPFDTNLVVRSFLLERDHGNIAVYSTETAPALSEVGPVSWQYLGHWHEALFHPTGAFGDAPLVVHAADGAEVARRTGAQPVTFEGRHHLGEGFEIVPIPGHTPGATAYLWERGDHRFLFSGDSFYLHGDEWVDGLLASSDRAALVESLELIRELDFDVLVPWAASAGGPYWSLTDRARTRRRIDDLLVAVAGRQHGAARVAHVPA